MVWTDYLTFPFELQWKREPAELPLVFRWRGFRQLNFSQCPFSQLWHERRSPFSNDRVRDDHERDPQLPELYFSFRRRRRVETPFVRRSPNFAPQGRPEPIKE